MTELWISGNRVDLYDSDSVPVAMSYQVNDIASFKDIQASFSNTFTVPRTVNNMRILGNADQVNTQSKAPYTNLPCRYLVDGIDIVNGAIAIIEEFNTDYSITILSGNIDAFAQIGSASIKDIDFSSYDHILDIVIVDYLNNLAPTNDLTYPFANYGNYNEDGIVDIRYLAPALSANIIMKKIFENITWQYSGDIFSDPKFLDLALPLLNAPIVDPSSILTQRSFQSGTNGFVMPHEFYSGSNPYYSLLAPNYFDVLTGGSNFDSEAGYLDKSNPACWVYRVQKDCIVDIELNLFFDRNYLTPICVCKNIPFSQIQNSASINPQAANNNQSIIYSSFGAVPQGQNSLNNTTASVPLYAGDFVMIVSQCLSGTTPPYPHNYYPDGTIISDPSDKAFISFTCKSSSIIGGTVSVNTLLPDMKQVDFIQSVCNLFGLIVQPNYLTNELVFKQFKTIRSDGKMVDWSSKLDTSQSIDILYRPTNANNTYSYGQQSWMRWIQSDSRGVIGDGFFTIDDQVLDLSVNVFGLNFASSLQDQVSDLNGSLGIGCNIQRWTQISANNYNSQTVFKNGDTCLYNGVVYLYYAVSSSSGNVPTLHPELWKVDPDQWTQQGSLSDQRLFYIRKCGSFQLTDGAGLYLNNVEMPLAYFVDSSQSYDLDFSNIIIREYQSFVDMMQKYKETIQYILLDELDIQSLDFFKMIYVEINGNLFYLNLVGEFQGGSASTACTLIRI